MRQMHTSPVPAGVDRAPRPATTRNPTRGKGEVYRRRDGKWAWRIKAPNGRIVATDGSQGYDHKIDAHRTVTRLLAGQYDGPVEDLG